MDDKEKHYSDIYISVLSAEPSVQYLAFLKCPTTPDISPLQWLALVVRFNVASSLTVHFYLYSAKAKQWPF